MNTATKLLLLGDCPYCSEKIYEGPLKAKWFKHGFRLFNKGVKLSNGKFVKRARIKDEGICPGFTHRTSHIFHYTNWPSTEEKHCVVCGKGSTSLVPKLWDGYSPYTTTPLPYLPDIQEWRKEGFSKFSKKAEYSKSSEFPAFLIPVGGKIWGEVAENIQPEMYEYADIFFITGLKSENEYLMANGDGGGGGDPSFDRCNASPNRRHQCHRSGYDYRYKPPRARYTCMYCGCFYCCPQFV